MSRPNSRSTTPRAVELPRALQLARERMQAVGLDPPVGRAAPGIEVRIAEDGEMAHIFTDYRQNDAATRAVPDEDGWLHTGDLRSLHENGFLTITGRKNVIITSGATTSRPRTSRRTSSRRAVACITACEMNSRHTRVGVVGVEDVAFDRKS